MTLDDIEELKKLVITYDWLRDKVRDCLKLYLGLAWLSVEDFIIDGEDATATGLLVSLKRESCKTYVIPYEWIAECNRISLIKLIDEHRQKEKELRRKEREIRQKGE